MPRPGSRNRFSKLFEKLRSVGSGALDGENAEFYKFLTGQKKITITNSPPPGSTVSAYGVGVIPFNKTDGTMKYAATFTPYSQAVWKALGSSPSATELGHSDIDSNTSDSGDFYPAVLKVFKYKSTVTSTSAVTGRSYQQQQGNSGTIPFGRKTATDLEDDRKTALVSDFKAAGAKSVSYSPEAWDSDRASRGKFTGTLPALP